LSRSGNVPDDLTDRLREILHVDVGAARIAAQHIRERTTATIPASEEVAGWLWADLGTQLRSPWHVAIAMNNRRCARSVQEHPGNLRCRDALTALMLVQPGLEPCLYRCVTTSIQTSTNTYWLR
jgi:hypothetical protein